MNYLAHLFLSESTPDSLIGNFLGDFVKGSIAHLYNRDIRTGIDLHRKVDIYTDDHPVFRGSKSKIAPERRRFAGILIDMFYDHFLARNWDRYSSISLAEFSANFYTILQQNRDMLPESVKLRLPQIIAYDLLQSYRDIAGIDRALQRISSRFKRTNNLADGSIDLRANYQEFEADFLVFFPDTIAYARSYQSKAT